MGLGGGRNLHFRSRWFQQDGETSHPDKSDIDFHQDSFGNRFVSLRRNLSYLDHSKDLTTPDAYAWGIVKEKIRLEDPT